VAKATKKRAYLRSRHKPDLTLLTAVSILLSFGVLMVYDASVVSSLSLFGGQYHYLLLQSTWVLIGLLPAAFFFFLDYRRLKNFALPLFLFSVALLILVLLPVPFAPKILGSRRWLYLNPAPFPEIPLLGRLRFQPSELAKLCMILYSSALFTNRKKVGLRLLLPLLSLVSILVLLEPDFGTTFILVCIGLVTYVVAGGSLVQLSLALPPILLGAALLVLTSPYRSARLLTYLNPALADPQGAGYQIRQILIALGSGGFFGLGIGKGRQKYAYLPGVNTDSIFAVVGEEFGFVGAAGLVFLYWLVVHRGFGVARRAPDEFGRTLAAGISAWFGLQAFVNLGAMVGIIPMTGITLPLVSYGGSSLVVMMAAFGILLNISKQTIRQ